MLHQTSYILEILTIITCIHCVYGKKLHINVGEVLVAISITITMEIANQTGSPLPWCAIMHAIYVTYTILKFGRCMKATVINTMIYMIVVTVIQFVCGLMLLFVFPNHSLLRATCANLLSLLFSTILLPKFELSKIAAWALKKNYIFYGSLLYLFLYICILLLQAKGQGAIDMEKFIFFTPFIVFVLLIYRQWATYYGFYEQKEREVELYRRDKDAFGEFVKNLRLRQHEINNHITAIMAMHYTKDTYDELVAAQSAYCNIIRQENKYNTLLGLYNSAITGFLYDKFKEFENQNIVVECEVAIKTYKPLVSDYYIIQMLGILLDNARDAIIDTENKVIRVEIIENERGYEYIVKNPHPYVSYEEIGRWFNYETSTKGMKRGLGLYHLKGICKEWDCSIECKNDEIENMNWIAFKIGTGRKE